MFLIAALTLGFLGSFHCVGMCGPIALALPLNRSSFLSMIAGSSAYNSGRLITYSIFGLLFGLIGQGLSLTGYQNIFSIALGAVIIISVLLTYTGVLKLNAAGRVAVWLSPVRSKIARLFKRTSPKALFSIGILNGLLPCGLVYTAIAGALATGSVISGSMFMFFFGMGTVPAMMLLHFAGQSVSVSFRNKIRKAVPAFVVIMGLLLIVRGMNLGIPYLSPKEKILNTATGLNCVHECCKK